MVAPFPLLVRRQDGQDAVRDPEAEVKPGKVHAVFPRRVVLVAGTGVVGQDALCRGALVRRELVQQMRRVFHRDHVRAGGGKAPQRLRVAVGIGGVGLDVIDGRAVHQVGTAHVDDRAIFRVGAQPQDLHAA